MARKTTEKLTKLKKALLTPKQIARLRGAVDSESVEWKLADLREAIGAARLGVRSAKAPSMADRRSERLLSTLRIYVEALGGEIFVAARFPGEGAQRRRS